MFKIAIVEDDIESRNLLVKYLDKYKTAHNSEFEYVLYGDGAEIINHYDSGINIIFMDIEMPVMDGMEAARKIRTKDAGVTIVFITNVARYAIKGYEVEALDFIVKPLRYDSFEFKMKRIINRTRMSEEMIIIRTNDNYYKINISDIRYVEVLHHTLTYHTVYNEISERGSMKETEEKLSSYGFCRCDSCYLVNLRYVTKIERDNVFLGETKLHISRMRKKTLMQALASSFITM